MENLAQHHKLMLEEIIELRSMALDRGFTHAANHLWQTISAELVESSLLSPEQLDTVCVCPGCGGIFMKAVLDKIDSNNCPTCKHVPQGHSFEEQPERLLTLSEMLKSNARTNETVNLGAFLRGIKDATRGLRA